MHSDEGMAGATQKVGRDEKPGEISQAIQSLDKEISELGKFVNMAEDKFNPALRPVLQENDSPREVPDSPYSTPAAQVISQLIERCANARRHLEEIINRGEL